MIPPPPSQDALRAAQKATWGAKPDAAPQPRMQLREWRPMRKNTLRGFCVIELPSGLVIRDVSIHEKAGNWWASLPSRPVLNSNGKHVSNQAGHKQYAALLGWRDRDLTDRFSAAVVELVRATHPGDLDGGTS
jgi:hypothetical protein